MLRHKPPWWHGGKSDPFSENSDRRAIVDRYGAKLAFSRLLGKLTDGPAVGSFDTLLRRIVEQSLCVHIAAEVLPGPVRITAEGHLTDDNYQSLLDAIAPALILDDCPSIDRKSTRLNSSHVAISYAVFCLKKKSKNICMYV